MHSLFFFLVYCSFPQYTWHVLWKTGSTDWHQFIRFCPRKEQSRSTSSDKIDYSKNTCSSTNHSFTLCQFTSHEHQCRSCFHPYWQLTYTRQHHYSAEILVEVHIRNSKKVCFSEQYEALEGNPQYVSVLKFTVLLIVSLQKYFKTSSSRNCLLVM